MTEETKLILERLDKMDAGMTSLDAKMTSLEARITSLEAKVTDIQLTLENETNRNIQIIAEGHFDLRRKLDDALRVENEKEMLPLRVNRIESELRRIKNRLNEIA